MHDQHMDAATQARRILDTWEQRDMAGLAAELGRTAQACATAAGASPVEQERMELLEAIAGQIRQDVARGPLASNPGGCADTCFRLLQHLATSGSRLPTRSEKPSFVPYSRSARRTSACR